MNSKGYKEDLYTAGCMRTRSGIYVNILEPTPDMFDIEDIAHALSMIPRFGGHLPVWYSVADHCLDCAEIAEDSALSKECIFNCLMHDASEAYICDIITPVKRVLSNYYLLEESIMSILQKKFGFECTEIVKIIDKLSLEKEWKIMLGEKQVQRDFEYTRKIFLEAYDKFKPNSTQNA